MKNQRYYDSINILMEAYLKGTLKHGDPCNCGIGSLLQGYGATIEEIENSCWMTKLSLENEMAQVLKKLPYSKAEIKTIEASFEERNLRGCGLKTVDRFNDPDGFNGLVNLQQTLYAMEDWTGCEVNKERLIEIVS